MSRSDKTSAAARPAAGARGRPPAWSLEQLRGFALLAQESSFTRAAQRLCLSQSALSSRIVALEQSLGLKLLDRTTRRVELTPAGRDFLPVVQRALGELDRAAGELHEAANCRRGRIRLGTTPLLASTWLPPLLHGFEQQHPGITLELLDASTAALLAELRQGTLDLVLSTFDRIDDDLTHQVLLRDTMVAACAASHPLAALRQVGWNRLAGERLLLLREGSGLRALVDRALRDAGLTVRPHQQLTHVATALALAATGMGVAIVPAYALQVTALPGMVARPLAGPSLERQVTLVHLRDRSLSPAARALAEHLQNHGAQASASRPRRPPAAGASRRATTRRTATAAR